jgi:hypothetical protein
MESQGIRKWAGGKWNSIERGARNAEKGRVVGEHRTLNVEHRRAEGLERLTFYFLFSIEFNKLKTGVQSMNEEASQEFKIEGLDSLIFANRKLEGMRLIREQRGCELDESLRIFSNRYRQLRAEDPEGFICDHERYWEGFYS